MTKLSGIRNGDLFVRTGNSESVKVENTLFHPNYELEFSLLYLNEKMGQPICLNTLDFFTEMDAHHFKSIGFNRKNLAHFNPTSEKVWVKKRKEFLTAFESKRKDVSVCLKYVGGPLIYQDPKTDVTSLVGISLWQLPLKCRQFTATRIEIQYQDISQIKDWIKEKMSE